MTLYRVCDNKEAVVWVVCCHGSGGACIALVLGTEERMCDVQMHDRVV